MKQQAAPELESIWNKWQQHKDEDAGNELVALYMPLVDYHVKRIAAHLPKNVSRQEVKSLGLLGLVDAIEKFDYNRDLKFDTYASFRIRGSIMDGLRREDWLPRTVRDKAKKMEVVAEDLEQVLGREPQPEEIADRMGISSQEVLSTLKDSLYANTLSLEEKSNDEDNQSSEGIGYMIPDEKVSLPEDQMIDQEKVSELADAIQHLNEKEQMVVSLFYQEELTLTEIGEVLELSTSRISQIHSRAIFKLRKILSQAIE
ncbi:RNA polymerase sigma factor for flagellar operon FliA [Salinibacillus kushneri]|uniref:RNA polymerase sigma factor for flagellar operon FliA n=1 Tax=Salinibacillus kushneri TaxID=237682 RepID=A0A1I0E760_9BACI|nr:FliA/WhiG family RNA polymerase sigma factor [Salinibacillus kushneri]SET41002.1 RNA polymerase sigma factor for flagellar operon FliA [Salinibacillus kushneri]